MTAEYLTPVDLDDPEFAELYDELPLWSAAFGLLLMEHVPLHAGMTAIDVGAGTGWATIELAQRCGPDATVFAVDPWTPGLAQLRRKLDHLGLTNVTIISEAVEAADLPHGGADLAVSNLGINNFPDPAASLAACRRLLRTGGTLALTTNVSGHMIEFYEVFERVLRDAGLDDRLDALAEHVAHRGTVDSVTGWVAGAGFEVADVVSDSFRMRFATGLAFLRHKLVRVGFLPAWRRVVPNRSVDDVFARLERALDRIATERGELAFTIPMLYVESRAV